MLMGAAHKQMKTTESKVREMTTEATLAAKHEQMLRQAIGRMYILQDIMRLVVQDVRSELARLDTMPRPPAGPDKSSSVAPIGEAQYHVLFILATSGSLTAGGLADRCHVANPTISKILNHLESDGLVERHIDPANRRVVRVVLTDAGRAAHDLMKLRFEAALGRVLEPLSESELSDLINAFDHLGRLVGKTEDRPLTSRSWAPGQSPSPTPQDPGISSHPLLERLDP